MIIVSNTSPIINLAVVGQLDPLEKLYGVITIPQAVYDEIVIKGVGQPGANEVQTLSWIQTNDVINRSLVASLEINLDKGEAEAIALALSKKLIYC